jgi:nucleotide-binding universal stress UspA family protein
VASKLFRRILVPHDFSASADLALREAAALAAKSGGRIHVMHALDWSQIPLHPPGVAMPSPITLAPQVQESLARLVRKRLGSVRVPVTISVAVGKPIACILDAARGADCIVMATHGRTGLLHAVMGSVAERVVRYSPIPVLTIRPPSRRSARAEP